MEKSNHQFLVGTKVGGFAKAIICINIGCMWFRLERESSNGFVGCK